MELELEADGAAAEGVEVLDVGEVLAQEGDGPAGGPVQGPDQVEESALPAP